ncbi:MAG: hypothetical protein KAW14_11810 [Candidatus Aegiribacteria sp.]|nr:hypothetical protein [Candidatus Aegiribacteria sp.]
MKTYYISLVLFMIVVACASKSDLMHGNEESTYQAVLDGESAGFGENSIFINTMVYHNDGSIQCYMDHPPVLEPELMHWKIQYASNSIVVNDSYGGEWKYEFIVNGLLLIEAEGKAVEPVQFTYVGSRSDAVLRVDSILAATYPGGVNPAFERIIPTAGQAIIAAELYQTSASYRNIIGGAQLLVPDAEGRGTPYRAMQAAALIPRLLEQQDRAGRLVDIRVLGTNDRTRERYEQVAGSGIDFTKGLARGSIDAPLIIAERMTAELFDEETMFGNLDPNAQQDIIDIMGIRYPRYATQNEELVGESVRAAANRAEAFAVANRVDSGLTGIPKIRAMVGLKQRIATGMGIETAEVDQELLTQVGYINLAIAANRTPVWAIEQLALTGEDRTQALAAAQVSLGYMGMTAEQLGMMVAGDDLRVRHDYMRNTLTTSLTGRATVYGRAIGSADIEALLSGTFEGDIEWVNGVDSATRERFKLLMEQNKLTTTIWRTILAE